MIRDAIHLTVATVVLLLLLGCGSGQPDEAVERAATNDMPQLMPADAAIGNIAVDDSEQDMALDANVSDEYESEAIGEIAKREAASEQSDEKPKAERATTWKRSVVRANTSRLMIGDEEELPLSGVHADVRIDGFRARVLLDCFFFNDRNQQFEGTFQLRLPNGASPYFCAFGETQWSAADQVPEPVRIPEADNWAAPSPEEILLARNDSWKQPKVARMVPREKAAFAYKETTRRQIDPALMEWSGAGVFNCRVFPLAPRKLHRIVVGYDVDLIKIGDQWEFRLDLPDTTSNYHVDLAVAGDQGIDITPATEVTVRQAHTVAHISNPETSSIKVQLKNWGHTMLVGSEQSTGPWFASRFSPELPSDAGRTSDRAIFMVDVSLSSNPDKFNIWLSMLDAILANNREHLKEYAVLFFNVEIFWWQDGYVANTEENAAALKKFCQTLALEGATDVGAALTEASKPGWVQEPNGKAGDLFLLSDGAATWGESDLYAMSAILKESFHRLFGYSTGMAGTDGRILGHLARESGGAVFSVVSEAEVTAASTAHKAKPWKLIGASIDGGSDLLLAGRPQFVYPGQSLLVAGRGSLDLADARIVLDLERDGERKKIETLVTSIVDSDLTSRIYGQIAVNQLEAFDSATLDQSEAYARHFRVTGKSCSLLMLDTEEDYERFNIKPEEDAYLVKSTVAHDIVQSTLDAIGATLGNPKTAFLNWLDRLEQTPGMTFQLPAATRLAIESMPEAAFRVPSRPLTCKVRRHDQSSGSILEALANRTLDYDMMTAESDRRLRNFSPDDALKALSTLVENRPGDSVLARDVGYSAMDWGRSDQAYQLFYRVTQSRPFEPQTYHAIGRCLTELGMTDLAIAWFEIAMNTQWDARFGEFHRIAGMDYMRLLRQVEQGALKTSVPDFVTARAKTVGAASIGSQTDLVVVIAWNTDRTDIDLHVIEPTGEECFYGHNRTRIGGRMTQDVTQGYGPEMYTLANAKSGKYDIRATFFGSDRNRASARTKVYATIIKGWGTEKEVFTRKVITLHTQKEKMPIATVGI